MPKTEETLMRRAIIAMLTLSVATAPAFAHRCPQEMSARDEVLRKADLTDAVKEEYRRQAAELHNAGKHGEALEALVRATDAYAHAH